MASTYKRVHSNKWPGVYYNELKARYNGKPDRCFYFGYSVRRIPKWVKVGKLSEGFSPEIASEERKKFLQSLSKGEEYRSPADVREQTMEANQSFGAVAEFYFETKGDETKGLRTDLNRYQKHLKKRFGAKKTGQILPKDIELFKKELRKDKAPATIWNILELLRRIINFGFSMNMCPKLSFEIDMPIKDNETVEYLTIEQAQRLVQVASNWEEPEAGNMVLLAFFTGMRKGEVFKLEEKDLDFYLGLIALRDPKGEKSTTIGMSEDARKILLKQLELKRKRCPNSKFVFPGRNGGLRKYCNAVRSIREAADIPASFRPFQGLRHNFGVTLANNDVDMALISRMLTHKSVTFTKNKYAQYLGGTLAKMSNVASDLLMGRDKRQDDENVEEKSIENDSPLVDGAVNLNVASGFCSTAAK